MCVENNASTFLKEVNYKQEASNKQRRQQLW